MSWPCWRICRLGPPREEIKPRVIMVVGVNGVGKTTTIGKLAAKATARGERVTENILILGLGGVGTYLAKRLVHEGYAVTAIEPDSRLIRHIDGYLDARLIQGSAMSIGCWREAGAENIDVLIAVTDNDAVNMLASMIADRFGIPLKIARVRSMDFDRKDAVLNADDLKIDLVIHPEELAAQEIVRLVERTAGNEIIDIADGQTQVMATRVHDESPLAHQNLKTLSMTHNTFPFRVVAIARGHHHHFAWRGS
jgi:trk system potassium uptake protein TrkA